MEANEQFRQCDTNLGGILERILQAMQSNVNEEHSGVFVYKLCPMLAYVLQALNHIVDGTFA